MKRTALYLSAALACLFSGQARAQSMDSVLVSVPESELPLLERNPRLDMLDLYNSQMEAKGENIFGGASYLTEKDDNYLRIRLTDVSEWELQRLTLDGDTLALRIRNNGNGSFAPAEDKGGKGIGQMTVAERVKIINGKFTSETDAEKGQTFLLVVPV